MYSKTWHLEFKELCIISQFAEIFASLLEEN
jgi:hypothetical protein